LIFSDKNGYIKTRRNQIAAYRAVYYRIVAFLLLTVSLSAYNLKFTLPPDDPNLQFKKSFIWAFTKYIEWPASYGSGDFTIGVLGDSPIMSHLEQLKSSYGKVDGQSISIVKYSSVSKIGKCHILYIPENKSSSLSSVINKLKGTSTLIITEGEGLARQGAIINFVVRQSKIKFEINKKTAESYSLQVSSVLSDLGILIQ
jgi:hypothetical protein